MAVDRVKELVQDGLRRKLSGDLKGAAEAWAEALKLDPTNKRAREGLDALRAQGIDVPKTPTPALGLALEPAPAIAETAPPKKNPFARPAAPKPFSSTPSPFPGEGSATPLSLMAPGEAPRVSAATPPPMPAPATPPTGTLVFGATGAPAPTVPPTQPPADTLSFGGPDLPQPFAPASPGDDFDLGADFNDPTPPIATPALGTLPFDPEPASTLVFGLSEHAAVPPPTPGLPPLPFESESGASLIFGLGTASSATPSSGTMVFGEKPPPEPTGTLVFGGPTAPVESSGTMVFGGPARGPATPAPADPTGTLVFGGPAAAAPAEPSGTMVFGKQAPTGAPAVPPSGTMVFGGPVSGPIPGSALDPASTLMFGIKGQLPSVQTDPFGKAASPGLVRSLELDVEDDGPELIGSDPPLPNPFSLPKIAPTPPSVALQNGPLVEPEEDDVVELYLDEPQVSDEPLVPPSPPPSGPVPLPKGSALAPLPPPPSEPPPGPSFIPQTMTGSFEVDLGDDLVPAERVVQRLVPPPAPPAPPAPPPPARPTTDPNSLGPLLLKATDLLDLDDHTGAMAVVDKILALDPTNATAHELKARCEGTLLAMYESKLGDLSRRPTLKIKPDEVVWLNLDHRAGFLLSLIDGQVSLDDLFSLSSMSRLDTARILHQLVTDKVIG